MQRAGLVQAGAGARGKRTRESTFRTFGRRSAGSREVRRQAVILIERIPLMCVGFYKSGTAD